MTHTQGPWKVTAGIVDNPRLIVEDDIGNPVCAMPLRGVYGDTVKMTANAHLISAAPEMYEALQAILPYVPISSASEGGAVARSGNVIAADKVRAALKKARGES